jgi:sirohydrochlorin ferrochelatase
MKAVLLISHGSHSAKTKQEISSLVQKLRTKTGIGIFEYAFLEIESPSIPEGLQICIDQGATEVLVLLNFLNSGRHVNQDIPMIVHDLL